MTPESPAHATAADSNHISALQKIFSFPAMLCGLFALLAVFTVRSRFDDPDMWWHLKTGEIIWTSHRIPTTDLFSYTTGHHSYIPHEWLAQLTIYGAFRFGGYSGLMLWLCFFTTAVLIGGYLLCWLYSGNARAAFVGAMAIWFFGTVGFAIRPQMIGYLLLIVELLLLHLGRMRDARWFLALPPLFAVWVNCHGSFFLGMVVGAVVLFRSYFSFQSGLLTAMPWEPRRRRLLAAALAFSALALLLNPSGIKLVLYPLNALVSQPIGVGAVDEWLPLQLGGVRGLAFLAVLAAILLLAIVRRSELYWDELLVMALAAYLAASHRRMLFPFGILIAPILCRLLTDSWDEYRADRDRSLPNAVLFALSLLIAWLAFPSRQNMAAQVEQFSPVKAVEFIKATHLSGPMLNDWTDGGYLIWAAPEYPVFIDGRADVFEWSGVLSDFSKWATLQSPPADLLNKYGVNFCLLERSSPMAVVLPLLPNWKLVYSDNLSVVFARNPALPQSP